MLAAVTRVRIRSTRYLPAFLWSNFLIYRQVVRTSGFFGGRLLMDARRTFWTLTVWEAEQGMRAFRGSEQHARAMPRLMEWCDESSFAHWEIAEDVVPTWSEAYAHLVSEGRLSRVANPSSDHLARRFMKPRLAPHIGMELHPVRKR